MERREREREELRRKILEAARELLLREGYPAVTMRRIADAIEYSPTAIYHHFEDKDDVIHSLCAEDFGRLLAAMQQAPPPPDPLAGVRELGRAYARFALEHPDHYRVMFLTPPEGHEHGLDDDDPGQRAFRLLREAVQAAMDAGLLRAGDAAVDAQVAWASLHGAVALLITYPPEMFPAAPPPADFVERVLETGLRGMATPAGLARLDAHAGGVPALSPAPRKSRRAPAVAGRKGR
jgi:AcrR family transcriptional regulator